MPPTSVQFTPPIESMLTLGEGVLFVFYAIAAIYLIFTAIIYYHWQQYSTDPKMNWITGAIYLTTTVPLLFAMTILAFTI